MIGSTDWVINNIPRTQSQLPYQEYDLVNVEIVDIHQNLVIIQKT